MQTLGGRDDIYTKADLTYDGALATLHVGTGVKSEGDLRVAGTKGYVYQQPRREFLYEPRGERSHRRHDGALLRRARITGGGRRPEYRRETRERSHGRTENANRGIGTKQNTITQEDTAEVTAVSSYFVKNVLESGG